MKINALFAVIFALLCPQLAHAGEDVFDKVVKTQTIRCGYPVWPPSIGVDPNTKKISGYSYDVVNKIGEKLNMKIDWVEETGWGIAEQGIKSGRYDMVCADVCTDSARTRNIWYSTPFSVTPNFIFGRADDHRFDQDISKINDPSIRIAVISNTILDYQARDLFPKAQRLDVTELGSASDVAMAVATKKADVSFDMMASIDKFNKGQERQLKVLGKEPSRYCYGALMLPQGDTRFKYMIDTTIHELSVTGELQKIVGPYFKNDTRYWRAPSYPYQPSVQH